ncbi:MAG: protein kinase [Gemmatimonadota bacterium]|nr:protein kinase [Gemmatimonadota bacterium]
MGTTAGYLSHLQSSLAARYVLDRELGRGGMACVYLAHDLRLGRDVAIKVLRPELAAGLGIERFLREVRIEAGLHHPHIVGLLDSGTVEQIPGGNSPAAPLPYYVMSYIAGESLRDRIARERQLPLDVALRITHEVGDALGYAHAQGVVHRDVKPGNILLADGHAWVADFGIARAISVAAGEQLTETGLAVGTPDYMSPEQASGDTILDGRSDVYALGCVLIEMLTGEPPFRGRTAQVILARHRSEPPPSVRILRPGVPEHVEGALHQALAKAAADRYQTVGEFLAALDSPRGATVGRPLGAGPSVPADRRRRMRIGMAALAVLVAGAGGYAMRERMTLLDPNRVVVFPLTERPARSQGDGSGEAVATYLGYALEGTAPLRWLDGWDFLDRRQRARLDGLTTAEAGTVARGANARYYLDGSIVWGLDSVTVVLRLHDVQGDSVLRRTGASALAGTGSLPQLGLRAMSELLPALLEPSRQVDLAALSERSPEAIASFLRGEQEYRQLHFDSALRHYVAAIQADSALSLAALKGGLAAAWLERPAEAQSLMAIAVRRQNLLPRKYRLFAEGGLRYWAGDADSAVSSFRQALAEDPRWTEAWMSLGEVYYHLLPRASPLDSLAEAAFAEAHRLDPDFTPALYHLVATALLRGETDLARAYFDTLRTSGADTTMQLPLALSFDCIARGPAGVDWADAVRRDPGSVLEAAHPLIAGPKQRACAHAAYRAVLQTAGVESRWGALLGLQGMLVAEGRYGELEILFASAKAADLPGRQLYLWDAVADSALDGEAAKVAVERGSDYAAMPGPNLWLLGAWEAHRGNAPAVRRIAAVLDSLARSGGRQDSVLARIMAAQATRVGGDTALAITQLSALTPSAPRAELQWQPWEAMAGERLALATLLLARQKFAAADSVAAGLENHRSVAFLPFLPAAIRLRARAAEAMGNRPLAAQLLRRLASLSPNSATPVVLKSLPQ